MKTKVIAVGSGKGGVGKSTVAAMIALSLKKLGHSVGLLDADLYGPSVPHLLGAVSGVVEENGKIQPLVVNGIPTLSVGYMTDPNAAIIWRGPLIHNVLTQFFNDTQWSDADGKDLEYLVVDMPPGTGDVPISLNQITKVTGAVVVCTPQKMALIDAYRAVNMFKKMEIPLLGVIENMSYFECDNCSKRHDLFGTGGVESYAGRESLPFLGALPLIPKMLKLADEGDLFEVENDPVIMASFLAVTEKMIAEADKHPVSQDLPIIQ